MNMLREQLLILISTPVYMVIISLEILLSNYNHRKSYTWKDTAVNVYLMLLNAGIDLLFRAIYLVVLEYFYLHKLLSFSNVAAYWIMLLIAEDFLYY
jgi:hypothetical protein